MLQALTGDTPEVVLSYEGRSEGGQRGWTVEVLPEQVPVHDGKETAHNAPDVVLSSRRRDEGGQKGWMLGALLVQVPIPEVVEETAGGLQREKEEGGQVAVG